MKKNCQQMNRRSSCRSLLRFATPALAIFAAAIMFLFLLQPAKQHAQTSQVEILLESKFDGTGNDGWTLANGTQINKWFVGAAAGSSAGTTGNAAYISNDPNGATFAYDNATPTFNYVHLYRDIDFPAELGTITLSFDYKGIGEGGLDQLQVFLIPANVVPQPGGAITVGNPMVGKTTVANIINGEEEWTRVTLRSFDPAYAPGNTRRLVFVWVNNNNGVGGPTPIAIDNIVLTARVNQSLAGSYTIDNTQTSSATNFNAFGEAVQTLNLNGVSAPTTFNAAAGQIFNEYVFDIVASGTQANPITFQKSGTGANPVIRSTGGGGLPNTFVDGGITIFGGNWFTFDGIDIQARLTSLNLNKLDYGFYLRNASGTNGAKFNTIKNCSIMLDRTNSNSIGILQAGTSPYGTFPTDVSGTNNGNKYLNVRIQNSNAGIHLAGTAAFPDDGNEIGTIDAADRNFIGAVTPDDIGNPNPVINIPVYGIRAGAQSNLKIYNNEIRNLTGTGGSAVSVDGIWIDNSGAATVSTGNTQIFNNRVYNLKQSNISGARVSGIRSTLTNNAASTSQIFNNFIYGLDSINTITNQRRLIGIFAQESGGAAATQNIFYNSVRLEPATLSGSNTAFETGSATSIYKIQNNIFANFTGSQTGFAKHYAIVSAATNSIGGANSISDNNILHVANPANGFTGLTAATDRANLADWRTATGGDANSRSQNPQFVSASDLHIRTDAPTPVESAGTPLSGVTTDTDGQPRSATTPDIGADEGAFQPLVIIANDIAAAAIAAPVPGSLAAQGTVVTPRAIFQNIGSQAQTNINVRVTITGPGGYNYSNDKIIASIASETTASVTFDNAPVLNALGVYTITATVLTADGNATNNTTSGTFTVSAPLSGEVTVGAGGTFTTLTQAINSLNAVGISGATTILLTEQSYSANETFPIIINPVAGASAANLITIKPAAGVNSTISGNVGFNGLIVLNGADFVTIDGSNNGTSSRNLTVINNSTNQHAVIYGTVSNSNNGAQNNIIKNVNILAGSTFSQGYYGIAFGGTLVGSAGLDHDNNRIENCNIQRAGRGIFFQGASGANKNTGNVISRNTIGDAASVSVSFFGISVALEDNLQITENTLNIRNSTGADVFGISLGITDASTTPTGLEVTNAVVARNRIQSVSGDQGLSSVGVAVAPATSGTNLIANNAVAGVISPAAGTNNLTAGILLGGGVGSTTQIYHNSISMTGNRGAISNQLGSFGIAVGGNDPIVDLRNNIFSNAQTQFGSGATGKSYAIGLAYSTFANLTSNFNDFYVEGTQSTFGITGGLINSTGTERPDLAAWKAATNTDINSISVNPLFVTATNLHLQPRSTLRNAGTAISLVATDFEGNLRDTAPEIGADELKLNSNLDFDGDGRTDAAVYRSGTWFVQRSTAGFTATAFGVGTDRLVPADYDGDGKADIAVFRNGNWFILQSSDNRVLILQWGLADDKPLPADYDGDGRADIAVFRPSNGVWYVLQSSNNQLNSVQWGQNGDAPMIADVDGDGKAERTVFRPSNGSWYSLNSTGGEPLSVFNGASGDIPQSGDFNGDGKTDLAVFRPSNGTWYIVSTATVPPQGFESIPFGVATDVPVAADYDGDGRTDIGVVRQTESGISTWFSLDSRNGAFRAFTFGASTDKAVPAAYIP